MNKLIAAMVLLLVMTIGGYSASSDKKADGVPSQNKAATAKPAAGNAVKEDVPAKEAVVNKTADETGVPANVDLTTEQIRSIMEKEKASVEDAVALLSSFGDKMDNNELKKNSRITNIKADATLTAGNFAVIAIEMKKAKGGIIYSLTGWEKYAAESLIHQKIYPQYYSWNRDLSGQELIEFVTALKNSSK